jgi:hypothetical protein
MNAAREKIRVAHALEALPKISASFEKGELKFFQGTGNDAYCHAGH